MPLSERQLRALDALEWLHDPDVRAEGRTTALAVAAIRVAARYPGTPVVLFDHIHTRIGTRNVFLRVRELLWMDYHVAPFAVFNETSLTLNLPRPVFDWLPPEEAFGGADARALGRAAGDRLARMRDEERRSTREGDGSVRELLAFNEGVSRRMAGLFLPNRMMDGEETTRAHARPYEMDTISQETVDRHLAEAEEQRSQENLTARLGAAEAKAPKKKKPAPKPEPKSVWERLLVEDD